MTKRSIIILLAMLCGFAVVGCGGATDLSEQKADTVVSLEELYAANQISKILQTHDSVEMKTEIFSAKVNDGAEDSYLGYADMFFVQQNDALLYRSETAAQSVPVIEEASNREEPTCVRYSLDEEEHKEVTAFTQEEYVRFLNDKWMAPSQQDTETILEVSEGEAHTLSVAAVQTDADGKENVHVVYTLDTETLEIQAVEKTVHTETDYGDLVYRTSVTYDAVTED